MQLLAVLYIGATIWLAMYGFNAFLLIILYMKHRQRRPSCPPLTDYPTVTVQLPIYNERYVVSRAISALAQLDWPRDRLQIQILDDSTDDTSHIVCRLVASYRHQGIHILQLRRTERSGFKAGAMNEAMSGVQGEFVAIFDADFCPQPDFLQRLIPYLVGDPNLAFVQARWGHTNDIFSILTLAQSLALDGHFVVEHTAREGAGLLTTFNGTGGVWRAQAIRECGGWDPKQLTEDVDLSYRAQLAGWRGCTLSDVAVPAELPAQLAAFKRQQSRWAKGNLQCLIKHGLNLVRAPIPLLARIESLIHLSYYLAHPLMLIVIFITLPLLYLDLLDRWSLAGLSLATLGPPLMYVVSQRALYADWWHRLRAMPALICIGIGLALNSTAAILETLVGIKGTFERTPKFGIHGQHGNWRRRHYALSAGRLVWGEALLTIYAMLTVWLAVVKKAYAAIPFLLLYVFGFGYMTLMGLSQRGQKPRRGTTRRKRMGLRRTPPITGTR